MLILTAFYVHVLYFRCKGNRPGAVLPWGGGDHNWKVVWGCAAFMTLFFLQVGRCSLVDQFTINAPLACPPFNFQKNFAFSALFLSKVSALKMQNFSIFVPKTPYVSWKTCSVDPTFGNRVEYTHKKKKKS